MDETPREKWAMNLGLFATIIPAMIASNFMPAWNVLPFTGWLAIAAIGAGVAGAIGTPHWGRGAVAGIIAGAGVLLGMWLYVVIRAGITGHNVFLKLELVVGAVIGAGPGLFLYSVWARQAAPEPQETGSLPSKDLGDRESATHDADGSGPSSTRRP